MYRKHYALIVIAVMFLLPVPAIGAVTDADSVFSSSLRVIWGLSIVLGVIFIIYAIAKKKMNLLGGGKNSIIQVVEMRHLLPKKSLCLVKVRGREYLLGLGAERVELIAAIDKGDSKGDSQSFEEILEETVPEV